MYLPKHDPNNKSFLPGKPPSVYPTTHTLLQILDQFYRNNEATTLWGGSYLVTRKDTEVYATPSDVTTDICHPSLLCFLPIAYFPGCCDTYEAESTARRH